MLCNRLVADEKQANDNDKGTDVKDWHEDLDNFFSETLQNQQDDTAKLAESKQVAADFLAQTVAPVFAEVKAQLEKHGRVVQTGIGSDTAYITAHYQGQEELNYTVKCLISPGHASAIPETRGYGEDGRYRGEGHFRSGLQNYSCKDLTQDDIRQHLLAEYKQRVVDQQRRQYRP
jgi:hypothetical protein